MITAKCLFTLEKSAKGVSIAHPLVKYANEEEYQMKDQKKKYKNDQHKNGQIQ